MNKVLRFSLGFIVGGIAVFALVYVLGMGADLLEIRLFDSESDQQRNFNIVMFFCLLSGVFAGAFSVRRAAWALHL